MPPRQRPRIPKPPAQSRPTATPAASTKPAAGFPAPSTKASGACAWHNSAWTQSRLSDVLAGVKVDRFGLVSRDPKTGEIHEAEQEKRSRRVCRAVRHHAAAGHDRDGRIEPDALGGDRGQGAAPGRNAAGAGHAFRADDGQGAGRAGHFADQFRVLHYRRHAGAGRHGPRRALCRSRCSPGFTPT